MEITLRPLTLGEILDRTASIYRKNFWLLAGISSVYAAVTLLIGISDTFLIKWVQSRIDITHNFLYLQIWANLITVIVLVLSAIPIAAVNRVISSLNLGEKITIRSAYKAVLERAGSYLWLMTLLVLMIYGPYAVFTTIYMGVFNSLGMQFGDPNAVAHMSSNPASIMTIGVLAILALIFFPALFAYMIWMMLRCALSIPASVVEGLSPRAAMRRSVQLTKDARGRIFVLYLLVAVIRFGLVLLLDGPLLVIVFRQAMKNPLGISVGLQITQQFMIFFITTFITPIYSTGFMLFYYDQRVRKEGFDIEWMMQSAGLNTPVAATVSTAALEPPLPALEVEPPVPFSEAHE